MNNKKIIFGIVLFLAICFLAFTFANPLEQGDGNGTLIENGGNSANSSDKTDDGTIVKSISFSSTVKTKIAEGESVNLGATVFPSTAVDKSLTYSSSNTSVLKVDQNGVVTGVGKGTATITVTSGNGKTNTITFTVGEDTTVADNNNTNNNSNNNGIAVRPSYPVGGNTSNGNGTTGGGNSNGSNSGNNSDNTNNGGNSGNNGGSTKPPVTNPEIPVTSININKDGFVDKLIIGQSTKISASAQPSNATDRNITYKSSNESVAIVDQNGNITTKGAGVVTITATSSNGVSESVNLVVIGIGSSKVSVIQSDGNISNFSSNVIGDIIKISGHLDTNDSGIMVSITVPEGLGLNDLNIKNSIVKNDFSNSSLIKFTDNTANSGSVSLRLIINKETLEYNKELSGTSQIYYSIDWLGNGNSVTYKFDFSGVNVD